VKTRWTQLVGLGGSPYIIMWTDKVIMWGGAVRKIMWGGVVSVSR
jgi:hypothetical protein